MLTLHVAAVFLASAPLLPQTPTLSQVTPAAGRQAAAPPTGIAAAKLWDQAGGMLEASSTPTLGSLYPLSDRLFVDPATGHVGMGTTAPAYSLQVIGQAISGEQTSADGSRATVSGGYNNDADGAYSVVAGGVTNAASGYSSSVGGGLNNTVASQGGVIGGGSNNSVQADYSFIGGGNSNSIVPGFPNYGRSVVAGGSNNQASRNRSAIGGGENNVVDGDYGCVPGGFGNRAGSSSFAAGYLCDADIHSAAIGRACQASTYSFAAGTGAKTSFRGSFVWSDYSQGAFGTFSTTAENQFLIRAVGGVGIGTNTPGSQLDVAGIVRSSGPTGGSFTAFNPNDPGVSASFSWLNDVARIRVGGSGSGAQNGFDIQTVSNTSLLRIAGNGDATAKGQMRATAFVQTSDARLKTDVRELEGALDAVRALRGVRFRWDREQRPDAEEGERVGFLAQEVREIVPEAVREAPDGMLAVSYAELVPVLVEALQEQQAEIARLRDLESRVLALETSSRDPQ